MRYNHNFAIKIVTDEKYTDIRKLEFLLCAMTLSEVFNLPVPLARNNKLMFTLTL